MLLAFNAPGQFPDSLIREVTRSIPADPDRLRDLLKKWLRLFKTTPQRLVQGFFSSMTFTHTRAGHAIVYQSPLFPIIFTVHGPHEGREQGLTHFLEAVLFKQCGPWLTNAFTTF